MFKRYPNAGRLAPSLVVSALLIAPELFANTANCEAIAAETVSELKAGAAGWWSEDGERLAGMAAASACFKTQANLAQSASDTAPGQAALESSQDEATEFMGLEVRPLSGPPSRKPYERTRD